MKLFLTSAGLRDEFKEEFFNMLGKKPEDCKIAFIPTACDPELDKSYVKWTTDQIEAAGFPWYEVDLKSENAHTLRSKLTPADIIMVNGGNTFYLLDQARKSGFVDILRELLDGDKLYFGISAGSYLVCPNIEAAKWKGLDDENVVKMTDYSACGLVDFLIVAHYADKWQSSLESGLATTNFPVVALTDQQAVMVDGEKIKVVGDGEIRGYNGFRKI